MAGDGVGMFVGDGMRVVVAGAEVGSLTGDLTGEAAGEQAERRIMAIVSGARINVRLDTATSFPMAIILHREEKHPGGTKIEG